MFEGHRNYKIAGQAQRDKEMVTPFKNLDWQELSIPSAEVRSLHSFRDKVRNQVREFSLQTAERIKPLLEQLTIHVSFEPVYDGEFGFECSKFGIEDIAAPSAWMLIIDEENYLKLTNIHF